MFFEQIKGTTPTNIPWPTEVGITKKKSAEHERTNDISTVFGVNAYGIALRAQQGVRSGIRLDIKEFHIPLKACAYRKKGDDALASRVSNAFSSSVACVELIHKLIWYKWVTNAEPA